MKLRRDDKTISMIWRIMTILLLVLLTLYLPGIIFSYADHRLVGQTREFQSNVQTYTNHYSGFYEILEAMTDENAWQGVSAVAIKEQTTLVSDEQLTEAVNEELKTIASYSAFSGAIQVDSKNLQQRQLYSLYASDTENPLNGIQLWQLSYANETEKVIVVMEVDFQKLCTIEVQRISEESSYSTSYSSSQTSDKGGNWDYGMAQEYFYQLSNGEGVNIVCLDSFKLQQLQKKADSTDTLISEVEGMEQNVLYVYMDGEYVDADASPYFGMGIWQIQQMMQF